MTLASGARLGPYEIVSPLGSGGMGEVYRARGTKLGRDVAIKVIPEHLAHDEDAVSRFEREARAVAALSHPSILSIHDFGRQQDTSYAVMELLEGETLRERLNQGPLSARKGIEYATQVALGLAAAHERGIVHRPLRRPAPALHAARSLRAAVHQRHERAGTRRPGRGGHGSRRSTEALSRRGGRAPDRPGVLPGEEPVAWSGDGRAILVRKRAELPSRVFRVDVRTGRREPWKELMPADPAGVVEILGIVPTPDGRFYAYSYLHVLTDLYLVEGLR